MTFGERLVKARKMAGLNQKQLAEKINITPTRLNYWEKDKRQPDVGMIKKLAEVLNITGDELLGTHFEISQNIVKSDEIEHIKKYRTLDEHGKRIVDLNLDEEYKRMINDRRIEDSDIEQEDQFTIISFYPIGASAGTGLWLFDDIECTTIQIPYTDESRRADFALPVRGDSMEPKFYDGDLLLVRQQPAIDVGEIGVFVLNDEGYVKKQGEHGLISLNDSYDDINISEFDSIYCKGKVVGCIPAEEAKKYLP